MDKFYAVTIAVILIALTMNDKKDKLMVRFGDYIIAGFWLLVVVIVWGLFLLLTPRGWVSIWYAVAAIFVPDIRYETKQRWAEDDRKINKWLNGNKKNTISGRTGYKAISNPSLGRYIVAQKVINFVIWWEDHHCFRAINWELHDEKTRQTLLKRYLEIHNLPMEALL